MLAACPWEREREQTVPSGQACQDGWERQVGTHSALGGQKVGREGSSAPTNLVRVDAQGDK